MKKNTYLVVGIIILVVLAGLAAYRYWNTASVDAVGAASKAPSGSTACYDSDSTLTNGTSSIYSAGYVTYNRGKTFDKCVSASVISEQYCSVSGVAASVDYSCSCVDGSKGARCASSKSI